MTVRIAAAAIAIILVGGSIQNASAAMNVLFVCGGGEPSCDDYTDASDSLQAGQTGLIKAICMKQRVTKAPTSFTCEVQYDEDGDCGASYPQGKELVCQCTNKGQSHYLTVKGHITCDW